MCITHHWWPRCSFRCVSPLIYEIGCGSNTQFLSPSTHSTSASGWREGGPGGRTYLSHLLLSPQLKTFSSAKPALFTQVWQQQPEGKVSIIHRAQIRVSVPSQHTDPPIIWAPQSCHECWDTAPRFQGAHVKIDSAEAHISVFVLSVKDKLNDFWWPSVRNGYLTFPFRLLFPSIIYQTLSCICQWLETLFKLQYSTTTTTLQCGIL